LVIERTIYQVVVAGTDISSILNPILTNMTVTLTAGGSSDSATITVDDSNGQVHIPPDDADIKIYLAGAEVFRGKVNDVKSDGGRDSGGTLSITCSGMDTKGKAKEPRDKHYDDKTVDHILKDAAKAAGYGDVTVDAEIGNIKIPYFGQIDTSLVHLGQKFARDFGGTFKIMGDKIVMVKRGAGKSATGKALSPVAAVRGINLINWSITPFIGRPRHKSVETKWYDTKKAKWMVEKSNTQDKGGKVAGRTRFSMASQTEAKSRSKADADEADRNKGEGSVTVDGNAGAQPEAKCTVSGARPGVDGTYTIDGVTHTVSRGGFTTSLTLKKPENGAGEDKR
jgi:uncharacterized protein